MRTKSNRFMATDVRVLLARGAALAPLVVGLADLALRRPRPLPVAAALDEAAHVATTVAILSVYPRTMDAASALTALAASVAIDADHVPGDLFGWHVLGRAGERPYPHALLTVALLWAAGMRANANHGWRRLSRSAALGVLSHLLRDAATGGVPALWPVSRRQFRVPYPPYLTVMVVLSAAVRRRGVAADEG